MIEIPKRARPYDYMGQNVLVIEDDELLAYAAEKGIPPGDAQIEALGKGIIPLRYLKNFNAIDLPQQKLICTAKVLICGCGGLGGIMIHLLTRAGVGHLRLADGDAFAATNLNRQLLCHVSNCQQPKTVVAAEIVRSINPFVHVEAHQLVVNALNIESLVEGMDLVLDGLDNLEGRFLVAAIAKRSGIPFIHGAVAGWWGQISTFLPDSPHDLTRIYGKRRSRDQAEEAVGVLGPMAATIGSMQALEAIRIITAKEPAYAGKLFYFDGERGQAEIIPL